MEDHTDFDFVKLLGVDISIEIFILLDDPTALIRACLVSSSWNKFVIANGLCKRLCLRMYPEISSIARDIEVNNMIESIEDGPSSSVEWNILKRNHKVYAFLACGLSPILKDNCIMKAISASSTDNYPQESICNTLQPGDKFGTRPSYWSSKGESDATAPETLIYKLLSDLCVVSEIHIQPFQAYFHYGSPIYSSKAVRFHMGHPKCPVEIENDTVEDIIDGHELYEDSFIWTYTSPEFPMAQENCLQKFKLPESVLCIGGILKVELLGRVQRQEMDALYYICVAHVRVVGRPLLRPFDAKIVDQSGKCTLKYQPDGKCMSALRSPEGEASAPFGLRSATARIMQGGVRVWEEIVLTTFVGNGAAVQDKEDESESESDDDLSA